MNNFAGNMFRSAMRLKSCNSISKYNFSIQSKSETIANTNWGNMQITSLMTRVNLIPLTANYMNIQNLRELIEKCKQQADVMPNITQGNILMLQNFKLLLPVVD